jgi:hypothetical protein
MSDTAVTMPVLTGPETITSLASSGILVYVQTRVWSATKQDQEISDEVTQSKNADRNSAKVVKYLMANCEEHRALVKNRASWTNWGNRLTFPWAGNWDFLPNMRISRFMQEFDERHAEHAALVEKLIDVYPTVLSNTAFQGEMFKREDYPSADEIRDKFSVKLFTQEVPTGDFRNQLSIDAAAQLQEHFNKQLPSVISGMMEKQIATMVSLMTSISKSCTTDTVIENGKVKTDRKRIYDTTIEKALELCDTYKTINVTNDPRIEEARAALERVLQDVSVDVLRESDNMRAVVKSGVDDILAKFGVKV